MRLGQKIKIIFLLLPILAVFFLFPISSTALAETPALQQVPVRIGPHKNFTRIVFDLPKLVAYRVKKTEKNVLIDLDINANISFPKNKTSRIQSLTKIDSDDGRLKINIRTTKAFKIKHFRLKRHVVVDIFLEKEPYKEKTKEQTAKKETPKKEVLKTVKAPVQPVTQEKLPKTEKKIVTADIKEALSNIENKKALKEPLKRKKRLFEEKEATIEKVKKKTSKIKDTIITLSFLSPTRIAVFERFEKLWIITDSSENQATLPIISGPLENFLNAPKVMRFNGGTAYRYPLFKKLFVKIKKNGLSWEVSLNSTPSLTRPPVEIKNIFDPTTKAAKLLIPLKGGGNTLIFEDPTIGDTLYIVPTNNAHQAITNERKLADLQTIPAHLGLVVRPLKDNLRVNQTDDFVLISTPDGLSVTPADAAAPVLVGIADSISNDDNNRLFDFPNWRHGGIKHFWSNSRNLHDKIVAAKTQDERTGLLMRLATLYFANNFGQETLGILDLVLEKNPNMIKTPDFVAIRGAAYALSGQFQKALKNFSYEPIKENPEVKLWAGFAAAAAEEWRMADRFFPKSNRLLLQYPDNIAIPFTIYMAESNLRLGHTDTAKKLLNTINMSSDEIDAQHLSAIHYLKGEIFSQEGEHKTAEKIWRPVEKGLNRLYHTKASLSLTKLLLRQKEISLPQAIERVDNLRFAWRGDGLEVSIFYTLGSLKIQNNQLLSGLKDLNKAIKLSKGLLSDTDYILYKIRDTLSNTFTKKTNGSISPLEAISVYNEFHHMLPTGYKGTTAALGLADHLIKMDLLPEAAKIIEEKISDELPNKKTLEVGLKLATIYLIDKQPEKALETLKKTDRKDFPDKALLEKRKLLESHAFLDLEKYDMALEALSGLYSGTALKLKAEIFFHSKEWTKAASTLEVLLPRPGASISDESSEIVVSTAVAWKLSGNTYKLNRLKEKYSAGMEDTKNASTFKVITRDGGPSELTNRVKLLNIAREVNIFKDFIKQYKADLKND